MVDNRDSEHFVIVGAGLGGLATAIAAAERGFRVTILEAGEKVGGAAAYSGGMAWVPDNHLMRREGIQDSAEAAAGFVQATTGGYPELLDTAALHRFLTTAPRAAEYFENLGAVQWQIVPEMPDTYPEKPGSVANGRYLSAVFDADLLGEWRDKLLLSPHFPYETNFQEIYAGTGSTHAPLSPASAVSRPGSPTKAISETHRPENLLGFGTGLVAGFLHYASRKDEITILLQHRVEKLLFEDGRVVGVDVETPSGQKQYRGKVVLATSGLDWAPDLIERFMPFGPEHLGTMAPSTLRGDGFRLAESAGAELVQFPARSMPTVPGYYSAKENAYMGREEYANPHTFIVNSRGERFCDDSYYRDIAWQALNPDAPQLPMFMIWDEEHHRRYGGAGAKPGGDYEEGIVESAMTFRELGSKLGIDGERLERTAKEFNGPAADASDPVFGRGSVAYVGRFYGDPEHELHPNIAPVETPPYFGMRLRLNMVAITMGGIRTDPDGRAVDSSGNAIPNLYAVGAAAAFTQTGTSYQGGYSLSRAITMALTVAECANDD